MFKKILFRSMMALALLTCAFAFFAMSMPSAHAAGLPSTRTITSTRIEQRSPQACTALRKLNPKDACEVKIVSTDVITQSATNSAIRPLTPCGTPTITHTESYTEAPSLWGFSQTGTFHWDGSCTDRPIVYSHSCGGLWAIPGYTITQSYCGTYPNGTGQTQMEDDIYYGTYVGGTFPAEIYSNWWYNTTYRDWWN